MIELVFALLVLLGSLFMLVGSVGLLRFPDVYTRLHAAGLSGTLGIFGILTASLLYFNGIAGAFSFKELLILVFLFLTVPVGTHMVGQAAYRSGVKLWSGSVGDELAEAEEEYGGQSEPD